jgi:hypothetical protein
MKVERLAETDLLQFGRAGCGVGVVDQFLGQCGFQWENISRGTERWGGLEGKRIRDVAVRTRNRVSAAMLPPGRRITFAPH